MREILISRSVKQGRYIHCPSKMKKFFSLLRPTTTLGFSHPNSTYIGLPAAPAVPETILFQQPKEDPFNQHGTSKSPKIQSHYMSTTSSSRITQNSHGAWKPRKILSSIWNFEIVGAGLRSVDRRNSKMSRTTGERTFFSLSTHSADFTTRRNFNSAAFPGFRISQEIIEAVRLGLPVVALESAIITHGMPYPHNIETAFHLQTIIRQKGAVPATVGVIRGNLTVGLSDEEIEHLGQPNPTSTGKRSSTVKVSRRDLPYALSQKLDGGTTVSGTIIGAVKSGIHIFATGGIGGVHRGAETSFDISADLKELGRNPITVVSAGVKSILDIGKTLEYLETEGVCVVVLGENKAEQQKQDTRNATVRKNNNVDDDDTTNTSDRDEAKIHQDEQTKSGEIGRVKFPSFFTAESQFSAPYSLPDELQAAHLVNSSINFGLDSGILIAVPIPKEHEAAGQVVEEAIKEALEKAKHSDVHGRDITPFLLAEINRLTAGDSLVANKYLIHNNVRVATQIAIQLATLRKSNSTQLHPPPSTSPVTWKSGRAEGRSSSQNAGQMSFSRPLNPSDDQEKLSPLLPENKNVVVNTPADEEKLSSPTFFPQDEAYTRFIDSLSNSDPQGNSNHSEKHTVTHKNHAEWRSHNQPVVIGGSSMDLILSIQETQIVSDGRTHKTSIRSAGGGVGRNVAEALFKLGHNPSLVSTLGNDLFGRELMRHFEEIGMDTTNVVFAHEDSSSTAIYSALLNHQGECVFGLGDMDIHSQISSDLITQRCEHLIRNAPILILDANIPTQTIHTVLDLSRRYKVPVWFEPTEVRKAKKILEVPREVWSGLRYMSPNLHELMSITEIDLNDDSSKKPFPSVETNDQSFAFDLSNSKLHELFSACFARFEGLEVILFTQGKKGITVVYREGNNGPLKWFSQPSPDMTGLQIKSVSGAGDCLNAGFISGILHKMNWKDCALKGTFCAKRSLQSLQNVPEEF